VAGILKTRDPLGPHSLALAEAFLSPLLATGFGDREAGLAFFLLVDYTIGFAVSGTPTSVNEQRVRDPAIRTQLHQFFRSLPPDRFPALVAVGEHVWVDNRDERFTAGLDVLMAGLEHPRNSPHRRGRTDMTAFDDLTWQEAMRQGHTALIESERLYGRHQRSRGDAPTSTSKSTCDEQRSKATQARSGSRWPASWEARASATVTKGPERGRAQCWHGHRS
jgi:hypothetical protein